MLKSFLKKVAGRQACNFVKKETPALVFSCEFCKIFKNNLLHNIPGRLLLDFIVTLRFNKTDIAAAFLKISPSRYLEFPTRILMNFPIQQFNICQQINKFTLPNITRSHGKWTFDKKSMETTLLTKSIKKDIMI